MANGIVWEVGMNETNKRFVVFIRIEDIDKVDLSRIDDPRYRCDHPFILKRKYGVVFPDIYGTSESDKRIELWKDLDDRFERHGAVLGCIAGDNESLGDAIAEDADVIARIIREEYGVELTEEDMYCMPFFHLLDILYNKLGLDEDDPNRYKP